MPSSRCASKPAETKIISGWKRSSAGSHSPLHRVAELPAARAAASGTLTMRSSALHAAAGIERVLEDGDHQDALVGAEDILGAVAVVDVEVHHRHAGKAADSQRMGGGDGQVVEEAEPHGAGALGVMTRRPAPRRTRRLATAITKSVPRTPAPAARSAARSECGFIAVSESSSTIPCEGERRSSASR